MPGRLKTVSSDITQLTALAVKAAKVAGRYQNRDGQMLVVKSSGAHPSLRSK